MAGVRGLLGCSVFSEHHDASWTARMSALPMLTCSEVGQRGSGARLQHHVLRAIGLAVVREPEELHHSNAVCVRADVIWGQRLSEARTRTNK